MKLRKTWISQNVWFSEFPSILFCKTDKNLVFVFLISFLREKLFYENYAMKLSSGVKLSTAAF